VTYRPGKLQQDNLATLEQVKQASAMTAALLLDVRSRDEYTGSPKEARSGHIPGAQWWPWEQSISMESGFTFLDADKLEAGLKKIGLNDRQTPVVVYCQSGHRASQSYLTLRHLGFDNVRVYTGSMLDYLLDKTVALTHGLVP